MSSPFGSRTRLPRNIHLSLASIWHEKCSRMHIVFSTHSTKRPQPLTPADLIAASQVLFASSLCIPQIGHQPIAYLRKLFLNSRQSGKNRVGLLPIRRLRPSLIAQHLCNHFYSGFFDVIRPMRSAPAAFATSITVAIVEKSRFSLPLMNTTLSARIEKIEFRRFPSCSAVTSC